MATESITSEQIADAFARIENELLESMVRNLERHKVEEAAEGFEWAQWQAVELSELSSFTRRNAQRYGLDFDRLNEQMEQLISNSYKAALESEERAIFDAIKNGYGAQRDSVLVLPEERLQSLLDATHSDMIRAEYATLRRAEDIYRQTIFDAQIYATSGAGTYAQAIDMATNDFLRKGVDGIVYRDGSRHSIREYSQMAVRTASRRAALVAEGHAREEWGVHTIFVNYRVDACPDCMQWVGQVLVDDVYSGGTAEEAEALGLQTLSTAMAQGLFHPNCRDTSSTYFEGITELPEVPTEEDLEQAKGFEELEQRESQAYSRSREYDRLEQLSLSQGNKQRYSEKAEEWVAKLDEAQEAQQIATDALLASEDVQDVLNEYIYGAYGPITDYAQATYGGSGMWERKGLFESELIRAQRAQLSAEEARAVDKLRTAVVNSDAPERTLIRTEIDSSGAAESLGGTARSYRFGEVPEVGEVLDFGLKSASKDVDFAEKVADGQVEGLVSEYGTPRQLGDEVVAYRVQNASRYVDVGQLSDFEKQQEVLIAGQYRVASVSIEDYVGDALESVNVSPREYAAANDLELEYFTSRKGKEMVRFGTWTYPVESLDKVSSVFVLEQPVRPVRIKYIDLVEV